MNQVSLTGRLVRDVELRATNTGTNVQNFCVAVEDFKQGQKTTHFIDVVAFGQDGVAPYLTQGTMVGISGKLNQNRWKTKDGQSRSKVEVVAYKVDLLGSSQTTTQTAPQAPIQPMTGVVAEPIQASVYDEDIPF